MHDSVTVALTTEDSSGGRSLPGTRHAVAVDLETEGRISSRHGQFLPAMYPDCLPTAASSITFPTRGLQ
uniref:Exonuclease domain-containing protein n=1 Tax=Steinernema glaseri TaxID=37863 RepID=A0A1I7ZSN8_9BILA